MRKIFLLLIMPFVWGCSITPQQKAESLVKKYLADHFKDPSNYEIVKFGELKTHYLNNQVSYYEITNTFKAKNEYGEMILDSSILGLNKDFTWVIGTRKFPSTNNPAKF